MTVWVAVCMHALIIRFEVFGPNCTREGELRDNEGVVVKTLGQVAKVLKIGTIKKRNILHKNYYRGTGRKLAGGWCWIQKDERLTKTFGDYKICIQPKDEWHEAMQEAGLLIGSC